MKHSYFYYIQPIASFLFNPFVDSNTSEISQQIENMINNNATNLEMEIIDFQSDIELRQFLETRIFKRYRFKIEIF